MRGNGRAIFLFLKKSQEKRLALWLPRSFGSSFANIGSNVIVGAIYNLIINANLFIRLTREIKKKNKYLALREVRLKQRRQVSLSDTRLTDSIKVKALSNT